MKARALALDLGSTRLKLAVLFNNGDLQLLSRRAFPQLKGTGVIREADPASFRDRVTALFSKAAGFEKKLPLGISSQRSSFLLWERDTGKPLTRILSWQDRRAQDWCAVHSHLVPKLWRITGLPLTAHYAGPKLAYLLAKDRWLAALARHGRCCFGTLETYLAWLWSDGNVFQTEPGMAARTQLMDVTRGYWSEEILDTFKIPVSILPNIAPFSQAAVKSPGGWRIKAVAPDQSAAALPWLGRDPGAVILNAGTGSFALRLGHGLAPKGFITCPIDGGELDHSRVFWEGPVNAGAALWKRWKSHHSETIGEGQQRFAAPERHGWGAPYWRGDLGQINAGARTEQGADGCLLQGYAFRLRQVIEGLFSGNAPEKVLLGGGLAHDAVFLNFLKTHLPFRLFRMEEPELSLWGAGWLADDCRLEPSHKATPVQSEFGSDTNSQYKQWCAWMNCHLGS